jgi:hypothetical protein
MVRTDTKCLFHNYFHITWTKNGDFVKRTAKYPKSGLVDEISLQGEMDGTYLFHDIKD